MEDSKEKTYQAAVSIRGDSLYCPLPLSVDAYWNCEIDCVHCYLRRLNRTWGADLRPADPVAVFDKLKAGLNNPNPKTPLAHCLRNKTTIRFGNKTDPFQPAEKEHRVAGRLLNVFIRLKWSFVVQTKCTDLFLTYTKQIERAASLGLITFMPVITPGLDRDWAEFEHGRTTAPSIRLVHAKILSDQGIPVGVNGEPFIPGYHTLLDFEETLVALRDAGIYRYNTYNLHLNDFNAKRLAEKGLDIERIYHYNQDKQWKVILQSLIALAKKYEIGMGCPDFVNSGAYAEPANTCCGVDVPCPATFNTHFFKKYAQTGYHSQDILKELWDGSGDYEKGKAIITGAESEFFTLRDAETLPWDKNDLIPF